MSCYMPDLSLATFYSFFTVLTFWKERKLVLLTYSDCRLSWGLKDCWEFENGYHKRYFLKILDISMFYQRNIQLYILSSITAIFLTLFQDHNLLKLFWVDMVGPSISARCFIRSRILKCVRWFKVKPTSHGWHPSIPFDSSQTFSP